MLRVGLTGGIGAGKSTVAARLAALGGVVIDADRVAREVVEPGTPGLAAVVAAFGDHVLRPDGTLDRPALGRVVFGDADRRVALNGILHPLIGRRTGELMSQAPTDAVVVHDVALLVEGLLGPAYHLVVVVHAPEAERVRRLMADRGMPSGDAWARVRAQASDDERRTAADIWIDNAGAPGAILPDVDRLWHQRLVPFEANVRLRRPAERAPTVTIADPDPAWPAHARRLAARVAVAAGAVTAGGEGLRVDHIGSTAVPGLAARDVIDLQLVVPHLEVAGAVRDRLADAGFAPLQGEWWDDDVRGGPPLPKRLHLECDPGRSVNLHVLGASGPAWRRQLAFRDWLRAHPHEQEAYARVKRRAAGVTGAAGAAIEAYVAATEPLVVEAMARAEAWARATSWSPGTPTAPAEAR